MAISHVVGASLACLGSLASAALTSSHTAAGAGRSLLVQAHAPAVITTDAAGSGAQASPPTPGDRGPGCAPVVRTLAEGFDQICTSSPGGNDATRFRLIGGLTQGEGIGQAFDIPASHFPIKIQQITIFLGTAAVGAGELETQLSFLVFDGEPSGTANPVFTITSSADGSTGLTHPRTPRRPSGTCDLTNGVLTPIIFCTDAGGLSGGIEPIMVAGSSGTNKVTVLVRINRYNGGEGPCVNPDPCNNALLAAEDGGQLGHAAETWVLAVNCAGGCPPGYQRATACPVSTGDFVLRMIYTPANCTPRLGACCRSGDCCTTYEGVCENGAWIPDAACIPALCEQTPMGECCGAGVCTLTTLPACQGCWSEAGTCTPNPCASGAGACCIGSACTTTAAADCTGFFLPTRTCSSLPCTTGACCVLDLFCTVSDPINCSGFVYNGGGSTCGPMDSCPTGACCSSTGTCSVTSPAACTASGGRYRGNGVTCAAAMCTVPRGACCTSGTMCLVLTQAQCALISGAMYRGDGTACAANTCLLTGACCRGSTCAVATQAACTGSASAFAGTGTTCNAFGVNNLSPCCLADYNHVGGITVQDIFDYLAAYFTGDPRADINGAGGVTVQDIFDFLAAYFAGGC